MLGWSTFVFAQLLFVCKLYIQQCNCAKINKLYTRNIHEHVYKYKIFSLLYIFQNRKKRMGTPRTGLRKG